MGLEDDDNELLKMFENTVVVPYMKGIAIPDFDQGTSNELADKLLGRSLVQWTSSDDKSFIPSSKSRKKMPPGLYEVQHSNSVGVHFVKGVLQTEGLVNFPETNSSLILQEVEKFWEREDLFKRYGLAFKRGILLWGPPGSGKTSLIRLLIKDVISRNGIVIKFCAPGLFSMGLKIFREIEPNTPCIILMEDIDSIIEEFRESEVINILDGVDTISKVLFIATSNYPEKLGERILNRPSRFDKRFKIGTPNTESRKIYFDFLFKKSESVPDIERWVKDTEGFSVAHLKELFVNVIILGNAYEEAVKLLRLMCKSISSSEKKLGFE